METFPLKIAPKLPDPPSAEDDNDALLGALADELMSATERKDRDAVRRVLKALKEA